MGKERDFLPVQFCDKKFVPFLTTKVTDFRTTGPMGDRERKGEPRVHDDIRVLYLSPLALRCCKTVELLPLFSQSFNPITR